MAAQADEIARVRQSAAAAFAVMPGVSARLAAGQPEQVGSPDGRAAYWLVPGLSTGRIQILARILPDGRIATVGAVRAGASDCAEAATGLSHARAHLMTQELAAQYQAARISQPVLVHDGPIGREAWLYKLKTADGAELWVFATGGGVYTRPAGQPPGR